jgi:hypothetical protein
MLSTRLAQSVERQTFNLVVRGSSPRSGVSYLFIKGMKLYFITLYYNVHGARLCG